MISIGHKPAPAWGKLPNEIATNPEVSAGALALLAYRITKVGTYALNIIAAANGIPLSNGQRGRTIGSNAFGRQVADLLRLGFLRRSQPKGQGGRYRRAIESINIPESPYYRHVEEKWHDGSLTVNAIATYIFIRAHNVDVTTWRLRERFIWGDERALNALRELLQAGLIKKIETRNAHGQIERIGYADTTVGTAPGKSMHGESTDGATTAGVDGYLLTDRTSQTDRPAHTDRANLQKVYAAGAALTHSKVNVPHLRANAFNSKRLLGWVESAPFNHPAAVLKNIAGMPVSEVYDVMNDEDLRNKINSATGSNVHQELLTASGLFSFRYLAAVFVQEADWDPGEALEHVLFELKNKIIGRRATLNSIAMIGKSLAGSLHRSQMIKMQSVMDELKAVDTASLLSPELFDQHLHLNSLLRLFDRTTAVNVIRSVLARGPIDHKRPGEIKTWQYFLPVIEEELLTTRLTG